MISAFRAATAAALLTLAAGTADAQARPRARDLGIPFDGTPGPLDAITDVAGVEVGFTTLIAGEGPLAVGKGPVRTGVTAVLPRGRRGAEPVFAGFFSQNGNGEMTGTHWIKESAGPGAEGNVGGGTGMVCCEFKGGTGTASVATVQMFSNDLIGPLFEATGQTTEEAILNAMVGAETVTGMDGRAVMALPHDRLRETMRKYDRLSDGHR